MSETMKINGTLADRISELEKENKELKQSLERKNPLETIVRRTESSIYCPYCEHELTDDEMYSNEVDLYALAPNEEDAAIDCPNCSEKFTVHGSYKPVYETLPYEDE